MEVPAGVEEVPPAVEGAQQETPRKVRARVTAQEQAAAGRKPNKQRGTNEPRAERRNAPDETTTTIPIQ